MPSQLTSFFEQNPQGVISLATLKRIYERETAFIGVPKFGKATDIMKNGKYKDLYYLRDHIGYVGFAGFVYNTNADPKRLKPDETFVVGHTLMDSLWFKTCTKNLLEILLAGEKYEDWVTVFLECLFQRQSAEVENYWIKQNNLFPGIDTATISDPPSSNVAEDLKSIRLWFEKLYNEKVIENAAKESARQERVAAAIKKQKEETEWEEKNEDLKEMRSQMEADEEKTQRADKALTEIIARSEILMKKLAEERKAREQKEQDEHERDHERESEQLRKKTQELRDKAELDGLIKMLGATNLEDSDAMEE